MSHPRCFLEAMSVDHDLRATAKLQHGVVSRKQAHQLGATTAAIAHRLTGCAWEAPTSRVFRLVGSPPTVLQALMGRCSTWAPARWRHTAAPQLCGGSQASSSFRCRSAGSGAPHRWGSNAARLSRPSLLPDHHVTERDGIPVTTLPRTLFDLASCTHPGRVERAVDTVVSRTPAVLPAMHELLAELGERGRNGIATMRAILDARPAGYVAPASGLEARFIRILPQAGEPSLERQVDVGGHEWVGRVDFVDRGARLLVEIDSASYHSSKLDRERDERRDSALLAAGWAAVVRISEEQVWRRPSEAVAAVRRARRGIA